MRRYDRSYFFAFGVLPAVNTLGLLLYGLGLSTHGSGGAARSLPAILVLAAVCLLITMMAVIKRGRDLAWPTWQTLVVFWLTSGMGPVLLVLIAYFAFAKPKLKAIEFGPPATPATVTTWIWALLNLIWPWMISTVLALTL